LAIEQVAIGDPDYLRLVEIPHGASWKSIVVATHVATASNESTEVAASLARQLEQGVASTSGVRLTDVEIDLKVARFKLGPRADEPPEDPATQLVEAIQEA
jgi:hypothetical protein